jgi:hypothetical protein
MVFPLHVDAIVVDRLGQLIQPAAVSQENPVENGALMHRDGSV